ncbi:MAG: DNA translocase FtsK 4TM domain-containing protein [Kiritimatiellia bacterium]
MTDTSSANAELTTSRGLLAWTTLPLALFPLVALLTYDWRAISALCTPPAPSTNWIGALGDGFAYYGYATFGLAIWIVPVVCVISALGFVRGRRRTRSAPRKLWLGAFLLSVSCLLQVFGDRVGLLSQAVAHLNIQNAGGWIGYLIMTRLLAPIVSDFGASVIMLVVMTAALIAAVGVRTIAAGFAAVFRWALARQSAALPPGEADASGLPDALGDGDERYRAVREARAAAKEAARQEKEAARQEKKRLKAEKRALKAARGRTSMWGGGDADAPVLPPPAPPPAPAAEPDPTDKGPYVLPPLSLLNPLRKSSADHGDVGEMSRKLIDTLKLFGVDAALAYTIQGPVVTKYALRLAPGIRYSAVTNISDNLMGALHAKSLRIEAPIPGEECVGIEVPNRAPVGISFREIIESEAWRNFKGELPLLFGKDAAGKELVADLASMPHMLVAGATGQGKSVCLNAIINGLLMTKTPEQLKLIMVDPKSVEFTAYASLPHLIVPVITDNKKVVFSLHWAVAEMEKRLKLFARARVRNIYDFNHRLQFTQTDMFGNDSEVGTDMPRTVPYIVIIIDEVADLMSSSGKEVTPDISRLTAKARAAGIHLILATQRPDAKIITGTIKANIPGRVAFKTATAIDSRTILDDGGAENLIGRGDMLFKSKDGLLIRAQGAWISDPEITRIISFIEQHSDVQFDQRFTKKLGTIREEEIDLFADPEEESARARSAAESQREQVKAEENASDFKKAVECIINTNRASTSHFQRKLGWGYNHSAKIMDMLEDAGIIGPQAGAGPRQIIMDQQQLLDILNGGTAEPASAGDVPPAGEAPSDPGTETNT